MENKWLSPEELSDELGVPVGTIYAWRYRGRGPRGHKFGKHVRFARSEIDSWAAKQADGRISA